MTPFTIRTIAARNAAPASYSLRDKTDRYIKVKYFFGHILNVAFLILVLMATVYLVKDHVRNRVDGKVIERIR